MREKVAEIAEKVLRGSFIEREEAYRLAQIENFELPYLLAAADSIRRQYQGEGVHLCSILNGRSGHCSEDCSYCAQSVHHQTGVAVYPLLGGEEILRHALAAEAAGVSHFSIVLSGRGMDENDETETFQRVLQSFIEIGAKTKLQLCASLGSLTLEQAKELKAVGVQRYHHNVETSRQYYSSICRTHSYEDRVRTVSVAQQAGLTVCCGGIIGMGETLLQRLDMAFELRDLSIGCVPINILNPIAGTRLEAMAPLPPLEIIKTIALFRFILPQAEIRTAGGREKNLRDLQALALLGGANGMLVGGYLTTSGRNSQLDIKMIADLGLKIAG